jgi:hypothetical protein
MRETTTYAQQHADAVLFQPNRPQRRRRRNEPEQVFTVLSEYFVQLEIGRRKGNASGKLSKPHSRALGHCGSPLLTQLPVSPPVSLDRLAGVQHSACHVGRCS